MTARAARAHVSAGRLAATVAGLVVAGAAGYVLTERAGGGGTVDALALAFGIAALTFALLRPWDAAKFLPAIVFANAGLVLADNYGAPNLVTGLSLLLLGVLLVTPDSRAQVLRATPVLIAFAIYGGVLVLSAIQAPGPADVAKTFQDVVIGLALVLVVSALASRDDGLRHSCELIVAAAAVLSAFTVLKDLGIGGNWFGFATDNPLSPDQVRASARAGFRLASQDRVTGPLADPNFWAQSLLLALPLSLWAIRHGPGRLSRCLAAVGGVTIAVGVVFTQSRGGAIALLIGIGLWLWLQGGRYRLGILLLPVLIVLSVSLSGSTSVSRS